MAESDETARAIVAGQTGSLEVVKMALEFASIDVRFTPESRHQMRPLGCPLCADFVAEVC
jgi:hypothetical protein